MSDEQEAQPLSGEARRLANLKPSAKGRSGNPGGHPKDLAKFAERGIDVSEAGEQTMLIGMLDNRVGASGVVKYR